MRKLLKRKNGEGYVDVAVTILIVSFVLLFAVNTVSLVALNQNVKTAADVLPNTPHSKARPILTVTCKSCQRRWVLILTAPSTAVSYTTQRERYSLVTRYNVPSRTALIFSASVRLYTA